MATTTVTPTTEVKTTKTVFDLASKSDVTLVKTGTFAPVDSMEAFVSRLGNDASLILKLANSALEDYAREQLASDNSIPWKMIDDEDAIVDLPEDFQPINPDKAKQLSATVINMAKLFFGYKKEMVAGNVEANREAKKQAKENALKMVLSNPAAVEGLKG